MTIAPESFDYVRDLVHRESAIVLEPGKEYLVESRLTPLAREARQCDVNAYVQSLRTLSSRTWPDVCPLGRSGSGARPARAGRSPTASRSPRWTPPEIAGDGREALDALQASTDSVPTLCVDWTCR